MGDNVDNLNLLMNQKNSIICYSKMNCLDYEIECWLIRKNSTRAQCTVYSRCCLPRFYSSLLSCLCLKLSFDDNFSVLFQHVIIKNVHVDCPTCDHNRIVC